MDQQRNVYRRLIGYLRPYSSQVTIGYTAMIAASHFRPPFKQNSRHGNALRCTGQPQQYVVRKEMVVGIGGRGRHLSKTTHCTRLHSVTTYTQVGNQANAPTEDSAPT